MRKICISKSTIVSLTILSLLLINSGCNQFSETVYDDTAGINGGFEEVQQGLPVNWLVYTPNTVKEGDFSIIIDTQNYKEGRQSLNFRVQKCSATGGWLSPGFCQEYKATVGEKYKISFWVKNSVSKFRVIIGGVSPFEGEYETIIETDEDIAEWRKIEYDYIMPEKMKTLRIELNVLEAGNFWIDDLQVTGVTQVAYH